MKERRPRRDALHATRAAVERGPLFGAAWFLRALKAIEKRSAPTMINHGIKFGPLDRRTAGRLWPTPVKRRCGAEPSPVRAADLATTPRPARRRIRNGILIRPRSPSGLKNAASVRAMLTTEVMIAMPKEDEHAHGARRGMAAGGMDMNIPFRRTCKCGYSQKAASARFLLCAGKGALI